jgi:hypothetical protein
LGKSIIIATLPLLVAIPTQQIMGVGCTYSLFQNLAFLQLLRYAPWDWVKRFFLKAEWFLYFPVWVLSILTIFFMLGPESFTYA